MVCGRLRRARIVVTLALTLGSVIPVPEASGHGGDRPVAYDPSTGQPIMTQREVNLKRRELAERRTARSSKRFELAALPSPSSGNLATPMAGQPSKVAWTGTLTYTPDNFLSSPLSGTDPCDTDECQEYSLTVPTGTQSLYLEMSWDRPDFGIYMYAFDPDDTQFGVDDVDIDSLYDKPPGFSTTLPLSQASIPNPKPGVWRIRARAAWGLNISYRASAIATASPLIEWTREDPRGLSKYATHKIPVNIVFAGIKPTKQEIEKLKQELPTQFRPSVLVWQFSDGGRDSDTHERDNCRLTNWTRCHYGGTYSKQYHEDGGHVPFFEPILFQYDYHFIQADDAYAKAAFQRMKELTKPNHRGPGAYLQAYTLSGGLYRNPVVAPNRSVDVVDALKFEDWIFETRFQFCTNFTNLETGQVHGGGFISPDTAAAYDPYYDKGGSRNIDRMPQGRNEGVTFFYLDTYSPSYAKDYFDQSKYHSFGTFDAFVDPDTHDVSEIRNARLWGGRYRFNFLDMGAAPTPTEGSTPLVSLVGGSADYPLGDPPIWQYRNDPLWQPRFISQGLARDVYTLLFARMTANYLYRPIPRDIYQLQTANLLDYYATKASGYGTASVDLKSTYNEDLAARWLSAAIPHVTLRKGSDVPGFDPYFYLKCSDFHVSSKSDITETFVKVPDPTCAGKTPDPIQQALEVAKSKGEDFFGSGLPYSQAASPSSLRNYWEANRAQLAPVADGVHSFILINVVFEKAYAWVAPLVIGGISYPTTHRENWGNFQSINELLIGNGFTYTVEHEASHALGLLHPFNIVGVDKDAQGEWNFYYDTMSWLPNITQSPTTYAGVIYPYGVFDQDNLQRGRGAEFIRMAQDAISDGYFEAATRGVTAIGQAPDILGRQALMQSYLDKGRTLFGAGDYLHAEYAFQNAYLAASGHKGPEVSPRGRRPGEKVFFKTDLQPGQTRGQALAVCGTTFGRLADTGGQAAQVLALLLLLVGMTLRRRITFRGFTRFKT